MSQITGRWTYDLATNRSVVDIRNGADDGGPSTLLTNIMSEVADRPVGPAAELTPAQPSNDSAVTSKLEIAVDVWRRRLLDLTRRNRALNFRPTKVSTVAIVDEQPVEVYRHLSIDDRPMRFQPMLESARQDAGTAGELRPPETAATTDSASARDSEWDEVDDEPRALELDFAPYDPESLPERHRDDILQAQATPEALDKSLRRLSELANTALEESGVNVLYLALGMLHYTETAESDTVFRAPLVMVPVRLSRRSARSGFLVEATEEEPIVNPALAELLRRQFGLALPELAALDSTEESTAIRDLFATVGTMVAERVAMGFRHWAVKTDIFLATFAFQKLVMFKDLEANATAFRSHRLTQQVVAREASVGSYVSGLPSDVREMELDRQFAPEQTAQVVDADSSQLRAIAAVSKGHDVVIEGPPGTGKSQTITNLIAQALNDGKSVLFVAEKMAALQVVYSRLVRAGLGEFCLELHAAKANKRAVMQEIRAALDASLQRPNVSRRTHRLPYVRNELSAYASAVHEPHGALGISPFQATGMLDAVLSVPRLPLSRPIDDLTPELLEDAERLLAELAAAQVPVGVPAQHPWHGSARTFYTPGQLNDIKGLLDTAIASLDVVIRDAKALSESLGLPAIESAQDVETALIVARAFEESPGARIDVLQSDVWNAPPSDATTLLTHLRSLQEQRARLDQRFLKEAFEEDHESDIRHVETKSSGLFGFLAILDGRYRAIKRRWISYRKAGYAPSLIEQAHHLKAVDRYRADRRDLASFDDKAKALFGQLWNGEATSADNVERYINWVVRVRGLCVKHGLSNQVLEHATAPTPKFQAADALEKSAAAARDAAAAVATTIQADASLNGSAYADQRDRFSRMKDRLTDALHWAAFERIRAKAAEGPAAEVVQRAMENSGAPGDLDFAALRNIFRRAVLEKWLEEVMMLREPLRDFSTMTHEQRIKEFRQLDEWILRENQASVVAKLRGAAQERLQQPTASSGLVVLQQQMAKQRNIMPLRKLLQHAEPTVRAIKPCFLMSPLTVAQYLDGRAPSFDLIIFDEASQLPTEDAIGAICRGKQLAVVGDPKQLPPTNFFASATTTLSPDDEGGLPVVQDTESVLEEFMGAGVPVTRLKWHYRSAHESLIAFSNVSFYDSDLYTFPSVDTGSDKLGLSFEFVADGVYEGKGMNSVEAKRVADAVVAHAKEHPHESLGVGTFNIRQQLAILDELELRRRQDPSIEPFFARGAGENFFVKNLENIQGDERDVIFLSVTYAKGPDGRLRMNFGALNTENGWRRLNVITTRARKRMRVFASMRGDDINAAATTARGAHLLREFLLYAERGTLHSTTANTAARTESPFESEVVSELTRRGIQVVPQVGVAGYRIDIGVLDPELPGRFICGIECDGVAYHASETARDRDRLRQQVLEARGWIIHRIWSTDWFKDRAGQIDRLLRLIEASREETRRIIDSEREAMNDARVEAERVQLEDQKRAAAEEERRLAVARGLSGIGRYTRPNIPAYRYAQLEPTRAQGDLLMTPTATLVSAIVDIVAQESPVHADDVRARIAALWATRLGSRIAARVDDALGRAEAGGAVRREADFFWSRQMAASDVPVRSRSGTRIPGDRIAPEELGAAVRLVLNAAGGMAPDELLSEVRVMFGVSKQSLAAGFEDVVALGKRAGWLGEGSTGLALRGT